MARPPLDPADLVTAWFGALNRRDLDAAAGVLAEQVIAERLFPLSPDSTIVTGREQARLALAGAFAADDGPWQSIVLRTVGGIGTGWGWVRAEWAATDGDGGSVRGHSQFLVEDGVIRRLRSEITGAVAAGADPEPPRQSRDYPARPVVGVGAVILADPAAQRLAGVATPVGPLGVVLVKRRYEPLAGQWSLPGGLLETGETLEAGTAREIEEETGLAVDVGPVVEVFDRIIFDESARVRHHYVLVDYLCAIRGGRLAAASDVADATMADAADLAAFRVAPKVDVVVRRALEMRGGR